MCALGAPLGAPRWCRFEFTGMQTEFQAPGGRGVARKFLGLLSPRAVDPLRTLTSFEFSFSMQFVAETSHDSMTISSEGVYVRPSHQDCTVAFGENTKTRRV